MRELLTRTHRKSSEDDAEGHEMLSSGEEEDNAVERESSHNIDELDVDHPDDFDVNMHSSLDCAPASANFIYLDSAEGEDNVSSQECWQQIITHLDHNLLTGFEPFRG